MSAANIENVSTIADKVKLVLVVALVVAALGGFYTLTAQGPIVQWLALIGGLVAAVVVFLLSLPGRQLMAFGNDAWREVNKVVWPTRKESTQMTLYVFAFVVIMALFLWLTDKTLEWVFYDLILGWKNNERHHRQRRS